jgi:hypothetical protein
VAKEQLQHRVFLAGQHQRRAVQAHLAAGQVDAQAAIVRLLRV